MSNTGRYSVDGSHKAYFDPKRVQRHGLVPQIGVLELGSCCYLKGFWRRVTYLAVRHPPRPSPRPCLFPTLPMKIMPNRKPGDLRANTDVASGNTGATAQEPLTLDEVELHLERLQGVSTVAAKLFALLGEQILRRTRTKGSQDCTVTSHSRPMTSLTTLYFS